MKNNFRKKLVLKQNREMICIHNIGCVHPNNSGDRIRRRGVDIDNQWVVPYYAALALAFGAHIEVEIAVTVDNVKFLYKYVYRHRWSNAHSREDRFQSQGSKTEKTIAEKRN